MVKFISLFLSVLPALALAQTESPPAKSEVDTSTRGYKKCERQATNLIKNMTLGRGGRLLRGYYIEFSCEAVRHWTADKVKSKIETLSNARTNPYETTHNEIVDFTASEVAYLNGLILKRDDCKIDFNDDDCRIKKHENPLLQVNFAECKLDVIPKTGWELEQSRRLRGIAY